MCLLDIVIRPRYYLPHFTSTIKVFELVLTRDNTKDTKNTVIQKKYKKYSIFVNPIQDGPFRGFSRMGAGGGVGGGQKSPTPLNVSHISHNDETWHSYTLPKEDLKNINHMINRLSYADIKIFYREGFFATSCFCKE